MDHLDHPGQRPQTHPRPASSRSTSGAGSTQTLFGVPMGDLGWIASLIMGLAAGFAAFFAATFVSIFSILFYNTATHRAIDFSLSYKRIGLPIGLLVGIAALSYLATMWIRRKLRHG